MMPWTAALVTSLVSVVLSLEPMDDSGLMLMSDGDRVSDLDVNRRHAEPDEYFSDPRRTEDAGQEERGNSPKSGNDLSHKRMKRKSNSRRNRKSFSENSENTLKPTTFDKLTTTLETVSKSETPFNEPIYDENIHSDTEITLNCSKENIDNASDTTDSIKHKKSNDTASTTEYIEDTIEATVTESALHITINTEYNNGLIAETKTQPLIEGSETEPKLLHQNSHEDEESDRIENTSSPGPKSVATNLKTQKPIEHLMLDISSKIYEYFGTYTDRSFTTESSQKQKTNVNSERPKDNRRKKEINSEEDSVDLHQTAKKKTKLNISGDNNRRNNIIPAQIHYRQQDDSGDSSYLPDERRAIGYAENDFYIVPIEI